MRKIIFILFLFLCSVSFAQDQLATDVKILGRTTIGSFTYIAVESDGKVIINRLPTFTDGSNEVSAKLDTENFVYVNLARDTIPKAQKTTSNAVASDPAQLIPSILYQKTVTINVNEDGKSVWVKVGDVDAGIDSGIKVYGSMIIDNASGAVISYYASPSCKIAIIQE